MHFKHSWQSVFAKAESHSKRVHKATKLEAYFSHKLPESRSQVSICIRPLPLLCRESCGEKNCHKVTHYVTHHPDISKRSPYTYKSACGLKQFWGRSISFTPLIDNVHQSTQNTFLEKKQKMNNEINLKK